MVVVLSRFSEQAEVLLLLLLVQKMMMFSSVQLVTNMHANNSCR